MKVKKIAECILSTSKNGDKNTKILAEATTDRLWGTGIQLRDRSALDTGKWSGVGWLSRMLTTIRDEQG